MNKNLTSSVLWVIGSVRSDLRLELVVIFKDILFHSFTTGLNNKERPLKLDDSMLAL